MLKKKVAYPTCDPLGEQSGSKLPILRCPVASRQLSHWGAALIIFFDRRRFDDVSTWSDKLNDGMLSRLGSWQRTTSIEAALLFDLNQSTMSSMLGYLILINITFLSFCFFLGFSGDANWTSSFLRTTKSIPNLSTRLNSRPRTPGLICPKRQLELSRGWTKSATSSVECSRNQRRTNRNLSTCQRSPVCSRTVRSAASRFNRALPQMSKRQRIRLSSSNTIPERIEN